MFSIKIVDVDPFLDATILFAELTHNEICLKFLPSTLSIIVRYDCPIFFVTISLPQPLFAEYSVDRNHISRISLPPFHNALLECETFAALNIHLQEDQNKIFLTFEPSSPSTLPLYRELTFVVPMEDWSPGQVNFDGKIFSIESQLFIDIIELFSAFNEANAILITSFGSKVSFSIPPFAETPLTEESGTCLILGDREIETQIQMPLRPSSFFSNCVLQSQRVWFFQSIDSSCTLIHFPFQVYAHFLMICIPFQIV